ncbi:hypothetical protein YC2023_066168 [Brassica napus]
MDENDSSAGVQVHSCRFGPRQVEHILQVISCVEASWFRRYESNNDHVSLLLPMIKPCMSVLPGRPWLSVCVCVSPSAHAGRLWLSISTHISTLVLGISTLTLPVDCSGDFGPRGLSVQYTQDVRGCPPAHTGRLWLSVCVRVCPSVSVSTRTTSVLFINTHISTLVLGLSTLALPVDGLGDFGPRGLSVQYKQDVRGSLPAHTGRPWLSVRTHMTSVAARVCLWVTISTHRMSVGVHQHTQMSVFVRQHTQDVRGCSSVHISELCTHKTSVGFHQHTGRPWLSVAVHVCLTLALPVDCLGYFGPCGLSVQYTQDVCRCPPAHTGRPWLSIRTQRTFVAVRVCPCVSVSTHRTSVGVRQHTQDIRVYPSAHTGRPWLSVCVHQHTQDVRNCPSVHISARGTSVLFINTHISTLVVGLSTLAFPVDCLGDFGPRGLSVQYKQDVCGSQPAYTGRPWLSVSTHKTSVAVRVCPCVTISTHRTSVGVRQHTQTTLALPMDCSGDFGPRGLSVQYTQDVCGCPSAYTGRPFLSISTHKTSVAVCVCSSAHIGRPCLFINTHIITLVLGLSTLTIPVDCSGDLGLRGLSVHYTMDVRGCPPAHIGRPWLSVCVRVCPSVSVSTHRTSVAVHQYTYQHYTQDVYGCPPAHTGCLWLFVVVRQHTQDVHGLSVCVHVCPCVSVSTHTTSMGVRQHTHDVRLCPSAHTGRLWLSVCVCVCQSAHTGHPWLSVAVRQHTQDVRGCLCLSVGVRQHTQDVCGCLWLSVSTHKTSVCVRVCPSAHTGRPWLSISTHISTLALLVDCSSDFGPRGLSVRTSVAVHQYTYPHVGPWTQHADPSRGLFGTSVAIRVCPCVSVCVRQHTQDIYGCPSNTPDVRGCPPAHTGRQWLSVALRQHTQDVRGCPCVSVSTHRTVVAVYQTSVAVRVCPCVSVSTHRTFVAFYQYTYQHAGPRTQYAALPVDCSGDFGPHGLSVQYTQAVRGFPPAHIGRPWLSVAVRQHTQDVRGCPCVSVCVRVCPSAHTGRPWLSISTHISTRVLGLSTLALLMDCLVDFGPCGLSVQYTQDVRGCPPAHTGRPWLSVAVRQHTQDVCGCPCLSVSTHKTYVAVYQYTYQHAGPWTQYAALPVDCSGNFGPRGLSIQYTQDVRWCPSAHTGRPWLSVCPCVSVSTHRTSVAVILVHVGCLLSTHRTSVGFRQHTQDVCGCRSTHTGRSWLSVCFRVCPSAHTGRPSIRTHISTLVLGLSMLAPPVDCLGDFGPCGLSVQYTQDVCGCQQAHTGRPWLSVAVRQHTQDVGGCLCVSVCVHVCPSAHTGCPWLSISTHISTLVLGLSMLALPVDCLGDFGPRELAVQYTQDHTHDVRGYPSVNVSARWSLDSARWPFPWIVRVILAHVGHQFSRHSRFVGVRQHTQDVRVCPSAHTGRPWLSVCVRVYPSAHRRRPWLSVSTHISTVLGLSMQSLPVDCSGDFCPRGLSVQYTEDVRGCPPAHAGRLWLSISTYISALFLGLSTLVLGLSKLAFPVDYLGDFGPCGLSVQYTQDVRGCPPAHTGCPWQHTHDVCGCPCVSVCVRQHTQDICGLHIGSSWVSTSTHRTSLAVRQHTQYVCGCPCGHPWLSVCVYVDIRGCPSAQTGRLWLSISTHISTLVLGLSTLALPVDCLGDFGPRGLPVQYTQDVRGLCVRVCPSTHTGRPWLSISTHISVLVLGLSTLALPMDCSGDFGPRGLSVQYTHDVRGCPSAYTGRPFLSISTHKTSVAVCVCSSAHIGRLCLFINTHIITLVLGLSTLTIPVDCSGDLGLRGLSVHYTMDVRGYPPAHIGRPWLSVCVRLCPSAHTGRLWLSISTHISTLVLGLSTLALPVDCLGDFGPRGLSVQYTQDVYGCPPAHTGCLWLFVVVPHTRRPWVSVSTHMTSVCVRQHTHDVCGCPYVSVCVSQHIQDVRGCLWQSVSTHRTSVAVCVCLWVSASTHKTSVAVYGCPSAHTRRPCVSVCVRQRTQDVRGCPSVHISARWPFPWTVPVILAHVGCLFGTHRTSVGDRQHTQVICVCPSAHTGRPWLSISTHISTLVLGLSTLTLPVDCSGDFGQRGLSVQYTQDVRGCPPAHTGRLWLSVCVRVCPSVSVSTHRTSVAVHQYTYNTPDVRGCPPAHTGRQWLSVALRQHTQDVRGCPCVSVSTHKTFVAVYKYTYQHAGPWTQHAALPVDCSGRPWLSVCVRVCPSAHTGLPWLSISTHISTLYTQYVRGFPPAHIGRSWLSVAVRQHTQDVRGCPCVSVCVCQHTQDARGCPSVHISARGTDRMSVGVRQHTQDVRGCLWLSVSTHSTSVAVRVCTCVSVSTHKTYVAVYQYTYQHAGPWTQYAALPMDCSGNFGPRGLSVQYTQDVRGCPSAHTGRPWLSMCVRVCPSAPTGLPWLYISTHISTLVLGLSTLPFPWTVQVILVHVGCLFSTHRTSVGFRQHTQDVRGFPCVSVCVRLCLSAHTGRLWLSISTHTLVLGLSTLALPVDCLGDFGPRGLFFQNTPDVRGCPPAHTGRQWLSVALRQHTQDVRGCPCVSVSTHKTFVAVYKYTYQHAVHIGRPWVSVSTHRTSVAVRVCPCVSVSTHRTSVAVYQYTYQHAGPWIQYAALPVDCSCDFGPRGLSVQYTQYVRGFPPAHIGRSWLSVAVRQHTQDVRGCPCVSVCVCQHTQDARGCPSVHISARGTDRMSVGVRQHTQDVRGCLWLSVSTHSTFVAVRVCTCVSVSTHKTYVAVYQYTYQHAGPWTQYAALPMDCSGNFGPRGLSVQYTQDVRGCPSAHTGRLWLSMCVRVCPSAPTGLPWLYISTHISTLVLGLSTLPFPWTVQHTQDVSSSPCVSVCVHVCPSAHTGRPWLSISTHISTLVLGLSTLALPVDCLGDFGPRELAVQYTQDVHGCPPAHTRRPWLSVCVRVCMCVSVSKHMTSAQEVRGGPSAHTGRPWLSVCVRVYPSAHRRRLWLSVCTHISTVLGLSMRTLPVDCSGDVGPRGLSVQYTQDVRGCPPAHAGRLWLSISTYISALVLGLSTLVLGLSKLAFPVDCLGDFGPCGLSVQYTQDVRGCPPAHTGCPWQHTQDVCGCLWLSVSTHMTSVAIRVCPCVSVCVRQHKHDVCGYPSVHISARWSLDSACWPFPWTVRVILAHVGYLFSRHMTSVGVCQHTQDVRVCPSAHRGHQWLSVCVRVCPSAQRGRLWLSVNTHISTVLGLSTLTLPMDCSGDFGPHGLSVQYTQNVCGCPPPHTGRLWLSVNTHMTFVAVRVCPSAHTGRPWLSISTYISALVLGLNTLVLGLSTLALPVDCLGDFGPRGLSVQYTRDVRGCPPAHTGCPWLSVSTHMTSMAVLVCPCVFVSTHKRYVAVYQYTYQHAGPWTQHAALPVDCLGDFGPRGLSVQYTQDVRRCPPVHTGCPWLSVAVRQHTQDVDGCPYVSVYVRQHTQDTQDVRGCPSAHTGRLCVSVSTQRTSVAVSVCSCVSVSTQRTYVAVRQYTYQHGPWTQHPDPSRGLFGGRTWLSVCVRVCPSAHRGSPWLSVSTHISTVLGLSTLNLPVECLGDFGPRGLSVQYTQDVRSCPPAHTGCLWLFVSTHRMSMAVRVCPCMSVSTHRTYVAVYQYTYQHASPWTQHAALPVDCSGDFGPRGLSVQYTQDIRGCQSACTGRPWLSVCVCVCPAAHTGLPWLSIRRADIEGSKSNVAMNAWLPQATYPCVGLESSSRGSSFPADSAKPVPLAVVSLDSRQGQWESR